MNIVQGTFKVMHRSTFNNLLNDHIKRYIMQHHELLRGWAIMSALHVMNIDAKLLRRDTYYIFKAKNTTGTSMTENDFIQNRLVNQEVYKNMLSLVVSTMPNQFILNTTYKDSLNSLSHDEFRIFVRSVMRTIAENESESDNFFTPTHRYIGY